MKFTLKSNLRVNHAEPLLANVSCVREISVLPLATALETKLKSEALKGNVTHNSSSSSCVLTFIKVSETVS